MIKVSDYIADFLEAQGVTHVFELIGGMITLMVDSLHTRGKIRLVSVHHEQAAAFAAEGYARMSGVPGVAMATSGPGATNLLTGIGSCYFDSTPAVFITGQVNTFEMKGERQIRQLGFQETNIVEMAKEITKAAWYVSTPEEVPDLLEKAFALALSGRPGPVLLDIPMDVQKAQITAPQPKKIKSAGNATSDGNHSGDDQVDEQIERLFAELKHAHRPLILAGGGLRSAQVTAEFRELVEMLRVPVVSSLLAVDALPAENPLRVGMIGSYGNRWANHAVGNSDFLLVLGSRLDIRQTGADTQAFKGERTIWHVDCEASEINNRVTGCNGIVADLATFLPTLVERASDHLFPERSEWLAEITKIRSEWPDTAELPYITGINPNAFMHDLSAVSSLAEAYVVDVGQHQMWAGQSIQPAAGQRFLTSGGMGAMGFALPTAIGAAFASQRPVVLVAGDGGFQVNIQELQTIVRNQLPIKMVILNNQCHGMVRQFQQSYFKERYQSTYWGYSTPSFVQVALAYGIDALGIASPDEIPDALARMWSDPDAPFLLEVAVDMMANAYPKIAFGYPLTEIEPLAKPLAMEGT